MIDHKQRTNFLSAYHELIRNHEKAQVRLENLPTTMVHIFGNHDAQNIIQKICYKINKYNNFNFNHKIKTLKKNLKNRYLKLF